jgi:pyruvate kinase
MVEQGMDWVRLNLSHGSLEEHGEVAQSTRDISEALGRPVHILVDLPGPKLRIGALPESLSLRIGDEVVIFAGPRTAEDVLPVPDARVFKALRVRDRVFLDDGAVELEILEPRDALHLDSRVVVGGRVDSQCGLTILGREPDLPVLSETDRAGARAALELGADAIAQSMVASRADVDELRKLLAPDFHNVSKIERPGALCDLERIAMGSWGLMVARGDLGVNIPRAQVPLRQKEILELCRRCGCIGIVATQLLCSMVGNRRPTRAEVSDVAGAILEGSDAIMLSEETSIGSFPVDAVREVREIAETVEASRWYRR